MHKKSIINSESLPPCHYFEKCNSQNDPRFTMDFSEESPGAFIYWCSKHGPWAHKVCDPIMEKLSSDPEFVKLFDEVMFDVKH